MQRHVGVLGCTTFGISARRGAALVARSVTALPAPARDQLTEELRTAEQLAQLLAPLLAAGPVLWSREPPPEAGVTVDHSQIRG